MDDVIESAANKHGVPSDVLDVIGRDYLSSLVDDLPSLMLPPLMSNLKQVYDEKGLAWMRKNAEHLRKQFKFLRQMYGPAGDEEFRKPDYRHML